MTFKSIRSRLTALFVTVFLAGCLGGGNSAPPPTGVTVVPGDGQVTVSWVGDPNVQYWILYAPGNSISTEDTNLPAGYNWKLNVTSPYVITGLVNGRTYAFAMNGRTDNGPGGASTASVTAVPRPAGGYWTAGAAAGINDLKGLTYGTSSDTSVNYLAVGANNAMYKSLDGVSWTALTSPTAPTLTNFTAAQYGLGYFLAAATNGNIYRSSDLATWTAGTTSGTSINAVAASGTLVVAVGDGGKIFTSTDALNWTARTSTTGVNLYGVTNSPTGLWFAVGASGTILTSPDGITWTSQNASGNALRAVAAQQNGTAFSYIAVGDNGTAWKSTDGAAWSLVSTGLVGNFYAITSSSVQFLAVGSGGAAYVSANGTAWAQTTPTPVGSGTGTSSTAASGGKTLYSVTSPTFKYVAVGATGTNITSQ